MPAPPQLGSKRLAILPMRCSVITYPSISASVWHRHQTAVMALEARAFPAAQQHPLAFYEAILDDPRCVCHLALENEQVVGFSFAGPLELFASYPGVRQDRYFSQHTVVYGADMVVAPDQQGKGIGKGLKTRQINDARVLGYERVAGRNRLHYADAMWAINQRLGAVEVQRLSGIYQDGREPNECIYYHITL